MKAHNTILFIVGVLAGLACLCLLFPAQGLMVAGHKLRFPTLAEALDSRALLQTEADADTLPSLSPEELLQKRIDELHAEKEEEFLAYNRQNPARLYMPGDDMAYLDTFFSSMQQAEHTHLRIMHYGDSQIECDRITSYLRQEFQEAFGGCGVGLVPALQTVPTFTTRQAISPANLPQRMPYGPASLRDTAAFYGPMAKTTIVADSATISLTAMGGKDYSLSSRFQRLTVLSRGEARVMLQAGDTLLPFEQETSGDMVFHRLTLPWPQGQATLRVWGPASIMGLQLDGLKGVSIDNIPMRGCSGIELTRISRASLAPFFQRENVRLIILQYGGNAIPYLTEKSLPGFKEKVKRTIALFQSLKPEARILFIGPSDMATTDGAGEFHTYPILPLATQAIREAADEAGVAFWDMFAAMGGKESMVRWVNASPQLAGADYIHFTPLGAKHVAHMLYETLQFYYRFYRFRTRQDEVQLTHEDSLLIDSTCAH